MFRYQAGIKRTYQFNQACQVSCVQSFGTTQRQAYAMQRHGVVTPHFQQCAPHCPAAKKVFCMDFEPRHRGSCFQHLLMVRKAQPDTGRGGYRAACAADVCSVEQLSYIALVEPPAILAQSPAGTSTNDFGSRAIVD